MSTSAAILKYRSMSECYLCAHPGDRPLALGGEFTGHVLARSPRSECLCDRCADLVSPGARFQYAWYWNANKDAWSKIFTRNTSWLLVNPRNLEDPRNRPYFGPARNEGKGPAHELVNMPAIADIRSWLLDPPDPPFEIVIADSGQKHILFLSEPARDRDRFPIQFELARVWITRTEFAALLGAIEALLMIGFTKSEIAADSPRIDRLAANFDEWEQYGRAIALYRGTPQFAIALKVATIPEKSQPLDPASSDISAPVAISQLALF